MATVSKPLMVKKRPEPRRVIALSPQELANLADRKANPKPVTEAARVAYAEYLATMQED